MASAASKPALLVSKATSGNIPDLVKPNLIYFSYSSFKSPSAYRCKPISEGLLNAVIPFDAPAIPRLNKEPSTPNLTLFDNLRKASDLPSLVSLSIMVIAKGSKEVPFNISPNVPISSSATIASPIAAPPIPAAS